MKFNPSDHIWLWATNLLLPPGLSRKLATLWRGLYKITAKIISIIYHFNLPLELALHDAFYTSLLKLHYRPVFSHPAPIVVADIDATEYDVEALLFHCIWKYNCTMKTEYLVK